MAKPATQVTFPAKSRSGAKLHRCIIIARMGYVNRDGYRMFMLALFVRICLYVIQVMFTVYLCFVVVRNSWNYVAMVVSRLQLRCTEWSTAATGFTMNAAYTAAQQAPPPVPPAPAPV